MILDMTDTLTDKIKLVIKKVDSIRGTQLNHSKRITALEEKPTIEPALKDNELLTKIGVYLGFIKEETKEILEEIAVSTIEEVKEDVQEEEIEDLPLIDPATEKALDEVIGED